MPGIWWTPYQVPNDHVALVEEKENCAKFCQNIVCIGPCQLGQPDNEYDDGDDDDNNDDNVHGDDHNDKVDFLQMLMLITMTHWLQEVLFVFV